MTGTVSPLTQASFSTTRSKRPLSAKIEPPRYHRLLNAVKVESSYEMILSLKNKKLVVFNSYLELLRGRCKRIIAAMVLKNQSTLSSELHLLFGSLIKNFSKKNKIELDEINRLFYEQYGSQISNISLCPNQIGYLSTLSNLQQLSFLSNYQDKGHLQYVLNLPISQNLKILKLDFDGKTATPLNFIKIRPVTLPKLEFLSLSNFVSPAIDDYESDKTKDPIRLIGRIGCPKLETIEFLKPDSKLLLTSLFRSYWTLNIRNLALKVCCLTWGFQYQISPTNFPQLRSLSLDECVFKDKRNFYGFANNKLFQQLENVTLNFINTEDVAWINWSDIQAANLFSVEDLTISGIEFTTNDLIATNFAMFPKLRTISFQSDSIAEEDRSLVEEKFIHTKVSWKRYPYGIREIYTESE